MTFGFDGEIDCRPIIDEYCYNVGNIASYVQDNFRGRSDVSLEEIWGLLNKHPVFPADGYKTEIKNILKNDYAAKVSRRTITFSDKRG